MSDKQGYFPLFINMEDKRIKVFGGGEIALRRVQVLLSFDADITVIAPLLDERLQKLDGLTLLAKAYHPADLEAADIVLAATDDKNVNDAIYEACKKRNILVNHCGNKEKCDFFFPGIVKKEELVIGITHSGTNHKKVKKMRQWIEDNMEGMEHEED